MAKQLEEFPITEKVYKARIKAFEDRLDNLNQDIKKANIRLNKHEEDIRLFLERNEKRKESLTNELNDLRFLIKEHKEVLANLRADEKGVNDQIEDRKSYLENQEAVITEVIHEGNERILDLKDEESSREMAIKQLQSDYTLLRSDYDVIVVDFSTTKSMYDKKLEDLDSQKRRLNQELDGLSTKIADEAVRYKQVTEEIDSKLKQLDIKEKSIVAQRDAVRLEKNELLQDKRHWESTKALYDV